MKSLRTISTLIICLFAVSAFAQVPQLLNYQGRVAVGSTNFDGTGLFKFALVNSNGTVSFWSNDGSSAGGGQPTASVSLPVVRGLYSVLLGDTTLAGMPTVLPATVFTNGDVRLRVWFNDGVTGFQQFAPDQRIAAVGYALMGANVPDGSIGSNKLVDGAVTSAKLANNAVTAGKIAAGAIAGTNLANVIGLGVTNVNGALNVYSTFAGGPAITLDGSGNAIRTFKDDGHPQALLFGPNFGELLLYNSRTNSEIAVNLSANGTSGGQLSLRNTNGSNRAVLAGGNTGGALTLYQADGGIGAFVDGDDSGAGLINLRNTNGNNRVSLIGQGTNGGGQINLNDASGTLTADLRAQDSTLNGGSLTLKTANGTNTVRLLAQQGSSSGANLSLYDIVGRIRVHLDAADDGVMILYQLDGSSGIYIDSDESGGGSVKVRNTNSSDRVVMDGFSTGGGGEISVRGTTGLETVEILGAESSGAGGQILLRDGTGGTTVQIDGDEGTGAGYISVYSSNGVQNIILDGNSSGDGRIICDVLQINGGADLSERFDITSIHQAIKPGMLVSINPDKPGDLLVTQKPYDRTVAGIISGAGGVKPGMLMGQTGTKADGQHPVALTGRVYCYVDADAGGAIEPGDLITTSPTAGHGMKVTDHTKASGAIIGKAMGKLQSGKGLVLVLVSLQ